MSDEQRHMLIVEDNPGDVRLIREALRDARVTQPGADFRLTHAARIEDALELVREGGIELILLDLDLPDSEGLDSFVRMRDAAPGVPIVVLTRTDDTSFALSAVRAGAQD